MANNKTKKKTEIQKTQDTALSEVQELKLTEETVLRYINQYATKQEIALFMNQCKMFNLNPFKREIYLIKYSQAAPASYVISFDVFLKRAERTKKQNGWRAWTEGTIKTKDFKALVEIHRKDWKQPFVHEVFWDEYAQRKGDGTLNKFWDEKPRTMLKKVVISQGHRLCYPDELGGLPYTAEEMPVDTSQLPEAEIVKVEVIKEKKEEKPKEKPKPKEEKKPEPEPEPEREVDLAPEPAPEKPEEEAPEPEAPPEKEKEEEDPGDPITAQTKRFIANALTALEKDYERDPTEIANKICDRFERLSNGKIKIEKFPDDLTEKQGRRVLEWLETTREKAEKKRLGE